MSQFVRAWGVEKSVAKVLVVSKEFLVFGDEVFVWVYEDFRSKELCIEYTDY